MKPAKCITCPLYKSAMISPIGDTFGAKVVFLLESPPGFARFALAGKDGDVLKNILRMAAKEDSSGLTAQMVNKAMYAYAVTCASKTATSVKLVTMCKDNVGAQAILNSGADVVVGFGSKTLAFFGIKSLHRDARGSYNTVNFLGKEIKVVTTFSMAQLLKNPGLSYLASKDVQKAARLVSGAKIDDLDVPKLLEGYDIPNTLEEAKVVLDEYANWSKEGKSINQTMMALDFETTSLYAFDSNTRAIALSGAVGPGKAFAVYIDHKDSPYEVGEILPWIWKVLQSEHPKTWWNYKFDYGIAKYTLVTQTKKAIELDPDLEKRIEAVVGKPISEIFSNPVNNTRWDGMLGEHMLDENKSGHYSLKAVVLDHYPSLAGYEKPLHEQLNSYNEEYLEVKVRQAQELTDSSIEYMSPIIFKGNIAEEPEKLQETSKKLKAKKRLKSTTQQTKDLIDDTVHMLKERTRYIKKVNTEVARLTKDMFSINTTIKYNNPKHSAATFEDVDPKIMLPYAAIDADLTLRISADQRKRAWTEDPKKVADREGRSFMMSLMDKHYLPLTELLSVMQVEGIRLDREYLQSEYARLGELEVELEQYLVSKISTDLHRDKDSIVLNNPKDLANIMIAGYGLPVVGYTDSGAPSSDNEAMKQWAELNPIAGKILEYKDICKARATYVTNLLSLSDFDGRVHANIWANGTATGRLSSSGPNLQNQPPEKAGTKIKASFVTTDTSNKRSAWDSYLMNKYGWSEDEELCVVDLDFAGAEVRGLTTYAKDPGLLEALNKGMDMHSWVASIVFDLDYDEINRARKVDKAKQNVEEKKLVTKRQQAKAIVFGLLFCISAPKLAKDLKIDIYEAESLMSMFFKRFPKIQEYIEGTKRRVIRDGVLRTPTGRARRFPMASLGGSIGAACGRQGVNYLVQGFTSEIVVRVLINLFKHVHQIKGRLMVTVHDSIVFEMPRRLLPELDSFLVRNVKEFIEQEFSMIPVPLPYDVDVGPSYGEAKYSVEAYTQI